MGELNIAFGFSIMIMDISTPSVLLPNNHSRSMVHFRCHFGEENQMANKQTPHRSLQEWFELVTECRQSGLSDTVVHP